MKKYYFLFCALFIFSNHGFANKPLTLNQTIERIMKAMPLTIKKLNIILNGRLPEPKRYEETSERSIYRGRVEYWTELKNAQVNGFWISRITVEERSDGGIFISIIPATNRCYSPDYLLNKYFDVNKPYSSYPERITYDYKSPKDDWDFSLGIATDRPKCIDFISIINGIYIRRTPWF